MNKNTAIERIKETFMRKFDEAQFTRFIKELLNDLEVKTEHYNSNQQIFKDAFRDHINSYKRIGKYVDPEGEALDVLIVEVKSLEKLEKARTSLRNFVIYHLKQFQKDYALVAFYSKEDGGADWRFSFVKLEYKAYFDEAKGKVKSKKEFTPAKRYSFLVGEYEKTHTAQNQILPLLQNVAHNPTVADLEGAFSIEKVTDEFFAQYKELYIKLSEHFEDDAHILAELEKAKIDVARFTKKLLGQIVFLYFLQKKGWLGVQLGAKWGTGNKRFMQQLFEDAQTSGENFFKDKLQYLFYEALAKERNNQDSFYARLNCRIPFLNGGLFEAEYDWQQAEISIPAILFRNEEKNSSGDIGTGVLDVLDRYNFTIKEDEPLDKEVAVDPEMLGKVFENMLEITERKSKGAFYTPREIVHYMCQESLIQYLDNALNDEPTAYQPIDTDQLRMFGGLPNKKGQPKLEFEHKGGKLVPRHDIEDFVRQGHFALENDLRTASKGESKTYQFQLPESIRKNAESIDRKLGGIRICDPAIGSGAFPVGLLHELVTAMLVLKPHFSENYLYEKLTRLGFQNNETDVNESRYVYRLKRHIIQECIYGVDLDPSAIDIARLRLWLSLVVDEDDLDPIETLPNLDYKIVRGNSLMGLPAQGIDRYPQLMDELESLKKMFFAESNEETKRNLRTTIDAKIDTVLKAASDFEGYEIDFDYQLCFSEVWHEKGGFDVVIGNPPYGATLNNNEKNILKLQYAHLVERIRNSFLYFIGLGEKLLNRHGIVDLIIPNEFLFQAYMSKARAHFLRNCRMLLALNIGEDAFKAIVPTSIIMFDAKRSSMDYEIKIWDFRTNKLGEIEKILLSEKLKTIRRNQVLKTQNITFSFNPDRSLIISKIIEDSDKFENYCEDVANGISTGHDKVYVVSEEQISNGNFEKKYIRPTIKGKDIHRFSIPSTAPRFLLYIEKGFEIEENPNIGAYLLAFKNELIKKSVEKASGARPWPLLFRSRYPELFSAPKILFRQTADSVICVADNLGYFSIDSTNIAKIKTRFNQHIKPLTAILNSEVVNFYYRELSQEGGRVFAQVKPSQLRMLPIPKSMMDYLDILGIITTYLENLTTTCPNIAFDFFIQINNAIAYELFFTNELRVGGKQILKLLSNLEPITDSMTFEKRIAIIQCEFERLYDPNHPVRYAIETLDSIEEVRIIKEALKS